MIEKKTLNIADRAIKNARLEYSLNPSTANEKKLLNALAERDKIIEFYNNILI